MLIEQMDKEDAVMLCSKCGNQLSDDAFFCTKCGTAVSDAPIQGDEPQQGARPEPPRYRSVQLFSPPSSQYNPIFMDEDKAKDMAYGKEFSTYPHPYHKLGGWLRFFVVVWVISVVSTVVSTVSRISEIAYISNINDRYDGGYDGSITLMLIIILAVNVFSLSTEVKQIEMVLRKKPRFLLFYEVVGIVRIAIGILLIIILRVLFSEGGSFTDILIAVVSLVIMLCYFAKSERVRTYFGSDEYLRRSIFFKKSIAPKPADTVPYGYE